MAVVERI